MARILIITDHWPRPTPAAGPLRDAIRAAGFEAAIITSGDDQNPDDPEAGIIRIPFEPTVTSGRLFRLRNALFFDTVANPGNYAMLRETLHQHLQEVLYDAVLILCPPAIYLKLGYWIDLSFGIAVWVHLSAPFRDDAGSGFHHWNHARLRRKYLGAAKLITGENSEDLAGIPVREYQRKMLATTTATRKNFIDTENAEALSIHGLLAILTDRNPQL